MFSSQRKCGVKTAVVTNCISVKVPRSYEASWRLEERHSRISDNGCLAISGGAAEVVRTEDFYDKHICQGHQV